MSGPLTPACRQCGKPFSRAAKFCPACGTRQIADLAEAPPVAQQPDSAKDNDHSVPPSFIATEVHPVTSETTRVMSGDDTEMAGAEKPTRRNFSYLLPSIDRRVSKAAMLAGGGGLVLLLLVGAWHFLGHGIGITTEHQGVAPADQKAWNIATAENSIESYANYIGAEPKGNYVDRARSTINNLHGEINSAWTNAQNTHDAAAVEGFLDKYRKDGIHIIEAQTLLQQIEQQGEEIREQNIQTEQNLVKAGISLSSITGDPAEMMAAVKTFQHLSDLPETGQLDSITNLTIKRAIERNLQIKADYDRARALHSQAEYSDFINRYETSRYTPLVRSLLAQCHLETSLQTTSQTETIQRLGKGNGSIQNDALNKARSAALDAATPICIGGSGVVQAAQYDSETCRENPAAAVIGGLFCGLLTAGKQRCTSYMCTANVNLQCVKTLTSNQNREVCP